MSDQKGGQWIKCARCGGTGLVAAYSWADFEGPDECRKCSQGYVWRYPSGALAQFPSGPFVGRDAPGGTP